MNCPGCKKGQLKIHRDGDALTRQCTRCEREYVYTERGLTLVLPEPVSKRRFGRRRHERSM